MDKFRSNDPDVMKIVFIDEKDPAKIIRMILKFNSLIGMQNLVFYLKDFTVRLPFCFKEDDGIYWM